MLARRINLTRRKSKGLGRVSAMGPVHKQIGEVTERIHRSAQTTALDFSGEEIAEGFADSLRREVARQRRTTSTTR